MNDDALKDSLLDMYEQAPAGYIFALPDGTILRANGKIEQWTGYQTSELLSLRLQDLLTMGGRMFYENQFMPLLRMQGSVEEIAFDLVARNGTRVPVLINSTLRFGEDGQPSIIASTVFSAAARRAYERELLNERVRAERLAEVVRASIDAIVSCSPVGEVTNWNAAAVRLLGADTGALENVNLRDLLPFNGEGGFDRVMQSLSQGRPVSLETIAFGVAGHPIDVSVSLTPHRGELGEVNSVSAIIRDISERRAIERLQQEFLAMASHELRTPLAVISGQAQMLRRRGVYNAAQVESIITQTRRLTRLIDDLLTASEIEADRLLVHPVESDIAVAIRGVATQFESDSCRITIHAPESLLVPVDQHRFEQVLFNLLANAVKYSPDSAEVGITVTLHGERVAIEVRDQGMGIRDDALPHLFERFYRAPDVTDRIKGTGLGLYITRRIVEAHGGTIEVTSQVGEGSTFVLTFPVSSNATTALVPSRRSHG